MLHDVKGLKDLEPIAEEPNLRRLHFDVPYGDLCSFVKLLGVILIHLPCQLDEEFLRFLPESEGRVIEFYKQLVHSLLNQGV